MAHAQSLLRQPKQQSGPAISTGIVHPPCGGSCVQGQAAKQGRLTHSPLAVKDVVLRLLHGCRERVRKLVIRLRSHSQQPLTVYFQQPPGHPPGPIKSSRSATRRASSVCCWDTDHPALPSCCKQVACSNKAGLTRPNQVQPLCDAPSLRNLLCAPLAGAPVERQALVDALANKKEMEVDRRRCEGPSAWQDAGASKRMRELTLLPMHLQRPGACPTSSGTRHAVHHPHGFLNVRLGVQHLSLAPNACIVP